LSIVLGEFLDRHSQQSVGRQSRRHFFESPGNASGSHLRYRHATDRLQRAMFSGNDRRDPSVVVYGVTTSMGESASQRLNAGTAPPHAASSPFPPRLLRRLSARSRGARHRARAADHFLEGTPPPRRALRQAVVSMLAGAPMRRWRRPAKGAGEILACIAVRPALDRFELEVKERGSLINGSPCAAA